MLDVMLHARKTSKLISSDGKNKITLTARLPNNLKQLNAERK